MFRTAKTISLLSSCVLLAAGASAQSFSESSAGGSDIPFDAANGASGNNAGWDVNGVDHDLTANDAPGTASVNISVPVTSIDSVTVTGLNHTWAGDVQVVLRDPNGVGHNVFIRPGVDGAGVGESSDFGGDYTIVEAGSPGSMGPFDDIPFGTIYASGTYDQTFVGVPGGVFIWPDGDENTFNTPMSMISGPAGTWTLEIWDWAAGDTGFFGGFTVNGNGGGGGFGMNYCDQTTPNSSGNLGTISGAGSMTAADNNLTLTSAGLPDGEFSYFVASQTQGFVANPNGSQGNLCVLGDIARFNRAGEVGAISGGSWSISVDLTDVPEPNGTGAILMGETWNFQGWHRDNVGGPTSNFTNGLSITFN